jgi:hypothetical protein
MAPGARYFVDPLVVEAMEYSGVPPERDVIEEWS